MTYIVPQFNIKLTVAQCSEFPIISHMIRFTLSKNSQHSQSYNVSKLGRKYQTIIRNKLYVTIIRNNYVAHSDVIVTHCI